MRQPVDRFAAIVMLFLCMTWGIQQVAIKTIAADISPTFQIGLRSGFAALLVWLFNRLRAREAWLPGVASGPGAVVGGLFAFEFLCASYGLRLTTASHMSVLIYTAPMFAALGLHVALPDERLSRHQWGGIALAFVGIAIAFLGPAHASAQGMRVLAGDALGLCAGIAWGLTTVAVRVSRLTNAPATQTLFYQLACASALLVPVAWLTGEAHIHVTPLVVASLTFQTVCVCFISFLTWFWLLRKYLAARLGVLTFMTPLFGVAFGALLLGEHIDPWFISGGVLVLAGLLIVNAGERLPWRVRRHRETRRCTVK